jgi:hypothetical protein
MEWAAPLARIYSAAKLSEDPLFPKSHIALTRLRRWRERLRWARHRLNAAPPAIRIVVLTATVLAVFSVANVVYQLVRKPTEIFFPVSATMNKSPAGARPSSVPPGLQQRPAS